MDVGQPVAQLSLLAGCGKKLLEAKQEVLQGSRTDTYSKDDPIVYGWGVEVDQEV